jgi:HlyD family secretion protein
VIRAPVDGIVTDRQVDLGSVVADVTASGGTVLATVADDHRLRLVADVDENDIALVRVQQGASVTLDAFPGETFEGSVSKVSSSGTLEGNLANFEVEIEIPHDPRVRVGMSADARVRVREHHDVLVVPNLAIARGSDGASLRVQDAEQDEGFRLVPIREVYSDGFRTAVEGEVKEGDVLVVPSEGEAGRPTAGAGG